MNEDIDRLEPCILDSKIKLKYTWWLGKPMSTFYQKIKDECEFWGIKCSACNKVYIPPKANCPKCFKKMDQWVKLESEGTLLTYTIVHYEESLIQPFKTPYAIGVVKLNGADTGLIHRLGEVEFDEIEIGKKFTAVFKETRDGSPMDIKYFKPV